MQLTASIAATIVVSPLVVAPTLAGARLMGWGGMAMSVPRGSTFAHWWAGPLTVAETLMAGPIVLTMVLEHSRRAMATTMLGCPSLVT